MKRRVMTVVLAVLLAAAGTAGVLFYVGQADARALAGQQAVSVLVAQAPIPAGTTADDAQRTGLLGLRTLPASSVSVDAVLAVTPELGSLVTAAEIPAGQLLVRPLLIPAAQATERLAIPDGMVAVSIQLCVQEGVAAYIRPGSVIGLFDTVVSGGVSATAQPGCDGPHAQQTPAVTSLVLTDVSVLAVGPAPVAPPADGSTPETAAPENGVLATVALTQDDAQRLIQLTRTGLPYAVLLKETS